MSERAIVAITANTSWYIFNFRRNLIKSLVDDGYSILAISPTDEYSHRICEIDSRIRHIPINIDAGGKNPLKDLTTIFGFWSKYRKYSPDIILNFTPKNNIYSTLAARLLRIPVINNIAGLGSLFIGKGLSTSIARFLYQISQPSADYVFFQNDDDRAIFLAANYVRLENSEKIPGSGVDLLRFKESPLPQSAKIRFLLSARILFEKGVAEFVEAAILLNKKYQTLEFRIIGFLDSKNPSAIPQALMSEWVLSGHITYGGVSDKVEDEILAAHCIVLPSYYREGVPRSLLEGAAMGRPIVTTDNVGCRDAVVENISGYLCTPRDSTNLAYFLEKIVLMSNEERAKMGKASRAHMEESFDENKVISRYKSIVNSLLS
jgi:glycosyltransferase involved in cell wall biosynthesis